MVTKKGKKIQKAPMDSSSEEDESGYKEKTLPRPRPESSNAKRSLEKADEDKKKKSRREEECKTTCEDETKNQPLFQRLFSDEDEVALLQGIIDFKENPSKDKDAFCDSVKGLISFEASNSQIIRKVRTLMQKFEKTVEKSLEKGNGGEDEIVFSKDTEQKAFDLWRKIWGNEGFLSKKRGEEAEKPKKNSLLFSGKEIISFFKAHNMAAFSVNESTMLAGWNIVVDGPKKRALEAKFEEIRAMQDELCLEGTEFVADTAKILLGKNNNTSSFEKGSKLSRNNYIASANGNKNEEEKDHETNDPKEAQDLEMENNEVDTKENNEAPTTALSLVERKHNDPKESHNDSEMENKEVGTVSEDANIEKKTESSATPAAIENEDSCVLSVGIKGGSGTILRKKLLVLDLNGLLADIVSPPQDYNADIILGGRAIFKRPFCEDFLKFCFDKFEVGVWSSRMQKNVKRITEFLFGDMKSKLLFCLDMSYCVTTTLLSLENIHKSVVFKDLKQVWEKQGSDYNEANTVLLDDSPYKALLNPPFTAIFPHSYDYWNKTDTSLGEGGDLRLYLEKLAEAENVQDFIKMNPFGQEAITEASESWEYYRQAVEDHKSVS